MRIALTYIYGIGPARFEHPAAAKIGADHWVKDLTEVEENKIREILTANTPLKVTSSRW